MSQTFLVEIAFFLGEHCAGVKSFIAHVQVGEPAHWMQFAQPCVLQRLYSVSLLVCKVQFTALSCYQLKCPAPQKRPENTFCTSLVVQFSGFQIALSVFQSSDHKQHTIKYVPSNGRIDVLAHFNQKTKAVWRAWSGAYPRPSAPRGFTGLLFGFMCLFGCVSSQIVCYQLYVHTSSIHFTCHTHTCV